jgi:hypothetical protein
MVTIIYRGSSKLSGPEPVISRLIPNHLALRVMLSTPERPVRSAKLPPSRARCERVPEGKRGMRMLQLIAEGMLRHPAAIQACRECPGGLSEKACERRLVRKYNKRQLPGQAP